MPILDRSSSGVLTPEVGPAPEVEPTPEVRPAPEVGPAPKMGPAPEAGLPLEVKMLSLAHQQLGRCVG